MNLEPLNRLVERIGGEALGELTGIATDWAKYYRHTNLYKILARWETFCQERNIEPSRNIAPRILLPIFEAASYEDDESLQELWARLIASGTDSNGVLLHPSFVEILKQITPIEARLLAILYQTDEEDPISSVTHNHPRMRFFGSGEPLETAWRQFCEAHGVCEEDADTYLDSLTHLYVLKRVQEDKPDPFAVAADKNMMMGRRSTTIHTLQFTTLGNRLMRAVQADSVVSDGGTIGGTNCSTYFKAP